MVLLRLLILSHSFVGLKGLAWPSGTYGIPETLSGCPDKEGVKWKTGWRRQHLEKKNQIPISSHLNATLVLNGQGIERSFCIKTISKPEESNTLWPAGKYCIYKYGESCPKGLETGSFHWDDVNDNNRNSYGGVLPEGNYSDDTTIKYCCQDSGDLNQAINLPFDKPFFLLPYKIAFCQHVKWTIRSLEKIVYDTENDNNGDLSKGHHARVKQENSLATAYYCYYKACRQTLRSAIGSFSSYNRSHLYCSWAIVVNKYFVISLTFSKLDIPDCQLNYLDIYEGLDEEGVLLARYCGSNATKPVRLSSSRNALFVVLKLGGNFDGLIMKFVKVKAEYSTKVNLKKCHETLITNKTNGSFTSPMYALKNYPVNQTCSWKIIVDENQFISLTFDYFYLPNCINNYIKIYDGPNAMSPLLTELCKAEIATRSTWNSTGNSVYIVYKSGEGSGEDPQKRIGFSANYVKRLSTKNTTEHLSTQRKQSVFKTTVKASIETTSETLGVFHPRNNSSGSQKVIIIVTASLTSFFILLLIIFAGLYKRRTSPFNGFLPKRRKESENPIYDNCNENSSNNPLYSSTVVPIYEEPKINKKDLVRTQPKAKEVHYELPIFKS